MVAREMPQPDSFRQLPDAAYRQFSGTHRATEFATAGYIVLWINGNRVLHWRFSTVIPFCQTSEVMAISVRMGQFAKLERLHKGSLSRQKRQPTSKFGFRDLSFGAKTLLKYCHKSISTDSPHRWSRGLDSTVLTHRFTFC